jgi:hypothetical protein
MQLPLFGPCCGREGRWPVRAIRVRWTEGVGSEAVEAGRSGDGGAGCDPTLVKYVCHMAVAGVLAYHGRGCSGTLGLPFAGKVDVGASGRST